MNNSNYIWPPYEVLYIESMLSITRGAIKDYEVFIDGLGSFVEQEDYNQNTILDAGYSIINRSAMISRYFWPVRKKEIHTARAKHLRDTLLVSDDNPLMNRIVRNHGEHFDENLDEMLTSPIAGTFYPSIIAIDKPPMPAKYFRAYFLTEERFFILDKKVNINELMLEIKRIHNLLEKYNSAGGRLPSVNR